MLKLPMIFSDYMVLQANVPVKIWGEGDSGQTVRVCIQGVQKETMVCNGQWEVTIDNLVYGINEQLEIVCQGDRIVISDLAVGEVWLAGGQSNMEFQLYFDCSYEEVLEEQQEEQIRFFDYPEIAYEDALSNYDYSDYGIWRKNDSYDNLKHFSAVGYYFARELAKKTGHVIGIVGCNWGGSPAHTWLNPSYLENTVGNIWTREYVNRMQDVNIEHFFEAYKKSKDTNRSKPFEDKISVKLMKGLNHQEQLDLIKGMPPVGEEMALSNFSFAPGRLYEQMVKKIAPYSIKGVLWYQGESDSPHAEVYDAVLTALIHSWRELWGYELPFYVVQLPAFEEWMGLGGEAFPTIRKMQEKVTDRIPAAYLCSIMDCGMRWDIHPKNKRPVGERLGKMALRYTYGYNIQAGSPRPYHIEKKAGQIVIRFTDAVGGLFTEDMERVREGVEVEINKEKILDFEIRIIDDSMVLNSQKFHLEDQIQITFANAMYYIVPIFNHEGFTIRPFLLKIEPTEKYRFWTEKEHF